MLRSQPVAFLGFDEGRPPGDSRDVPGGLLLIHRSLFWNFAAL